MNKFSAFLNLHYGIDIIETALETNTVVSQNQRSAMLEHDGNTTLELGHMFDRGLKFSGTKLSIGTRFNITEIYN